MNIHHMQQRSTYGRDLPGGSSKEQIVQSFNFAHPLANHLTVVRINFLHLVVNMYFHFLASTQKKRCNAGKLSKTNIYSLTQFSYFVATFFLVIMASFYIKSDPFFLLLTSFFLAHYLPFCIFVTFICLCVCLYVCHFICQSVGLSAFQSIVVLWTVCP